MFEERWEKINKGKYDLQELVKPPGLKSDKKTRLKEANHNIKEVMYQMLYDDQKFGLADKKKELFGTTI